MYVILRGRVKGDEVSSRRCPQSGPSFWHSASCSQNWLIGNIPDLSDSSSVRSSISSCLSMWIIDSFTHSLTRVGLCIYGHACIQTRTHARTHARARAHTHTHTHSLSLSLSNTHTRTHARTHAHARTHTHIHTHTHTHTHTYTHTHTHTQTDHTHTNTNRPV